MSRGYNRTSGLSARERAARARADFEGAGTGYNAGPAVNKDFKLTPKQALAKYNSNEDQNYHSENVLLVAQAVGSKEDIEEAKSYIKLRDKEQGLGGDTVKKQYELYMKLKDKFDAFTGQSKFGAKETELVMFPTDEARTRKYESEGMDRSDAQSAVEAENKDARDSRLALLDSFEALHSDDNAKNKEGVDGMEAAVFVSKNLGDGNLSAAKKSLESLELALTKWRESRGAIGTAAEKKFENLVSSAKKAVEAHEKVLPARSAEPAAAAKSLKEMGIDQLARMAARNWRESSKKGVYFGAKPYLEAMGSLNSIADNYGADSGKEIVNYFLANATSWKGEVAKAVKDELKRRVKNGDFGS